MSAKRGKKGGFSIQLTGDWKKAKAIFDSVEQGSLKRALEQAIHQEALYLSTMVRKKLESGPFKPLSPLTLAARKLAGIGGSKPLIASGNLRNAITVSPSTPGLTKFIGVLRTARGKNGKGLANIAQIQEEGRVFIVKMTDKMRRFLFGVLLPKAGITPSGGGVGRGFIVVRIPPRPFIRPVFEELGPTVPERIEERLARLLRGRLSS